MEVLIINLNKVLSGFTLDNGIYYMHKRDDISYPEYGNDIFFKVEDESFWFKHRNNCIIEVVNRFCGKNDVFFDVGGGNGYVSKGLQSAGIETVLVEPGISGVINAKKRGVNNIICSTVQNIDFKGERINAVGLFDVIEHVEDDIAFIKSLYECTEKNGYIFITTPAYKLLWSDEDIEAGHFRRYTLKSLKLKLDLVGYEEVYSTYIFGFLLLPILLMRTIPYILGFSKRRKKSLGERQSEHKANQSLVNTIIDALLAFELKIISRKMKMFFGGSCLVVARKKT
ncbi:MAG: class I SAM-dependent methyltransferase [bacterium]